jgi:hypothetical protein
LRKILTHLSFNFQEIMDKKLFFISFVGEESNKLIRLAYLSLKEDENHRFFFVFFRKAE